MAQAVPALPRAAVQQAPWPTTIAAPPAPRPAPAQNRPRPIPAAFQRRVPTRPGPALEEVQAAPAWMSGTSPLWPWRPGVHQVSAVLLLPAPSWTDPSCRRVEPRDRRVFWSGPVDWWT